MYRCALFHWLKLFHDTYMQWVKIIHSSFLSFAATKKKKSGAMNILAHAFSYI